VQEERSALEDILTISLYQLMDQNSPPEFQAEWVTRIQNMDTPEGVVLRQRLNFNINRVNSEDGNSFESIEYRLPILRLVTTCMKPANARLHWSFPTNLNL